MPQEPEDGRRFARDMRRIREARNLTVGDLHDDTKIPQGLIEAFEEKALFDHPQFNRVYLRSFVRTDAQVVEIDAEVALEGLEEALAGSYAGLLAVTYLGEEPDEIPADEGVVNETETPSPADAEFTAESPVSGEEPSAGRPTEEERDEGSSGDTDGEREKPVEREGAGLEGGKTPKAGIEHEPSGRKDRSPREEEDEPLEEEDDDSPRSYVSTTQATAAGYHKSRIDQEEAEEEPEEDWTAQSPPSGAGERRAVRRSRRDGPDRRWILGGALVVVVAALVWIMASVIGSSEEPAPMPTVAEDTAETVEAPDTIPAAGPPVDVPSLGDSINVRIIAAHGVVDPIRVTVDDDLRRPYWIELGDSMTFEPTTRIVIEDLLDSVDVKLEGIEYPRDRVDEQGRIVITRDTAEDYFDSLRQDG